MRPVRFALPLMIAFLAAHTHAQTSPRHTADGFHTWISYTGDHKVSKHWGIHLEAVLRRADFLSTPQQFMPRVAINYHFSPRIFVALGYAFVDTYPYGEFPVKATFPEHRIYEQLQGRSNEGRFEIVQRLRLEQRWNHLPVQQPSSDYAPGPAVYSNRVRYLLRFSVPFKGKTIEDHSWYATVSNEAFVNFGKHVLYNIFDQNRAYAAIGYKLPKVGRLEVGYLNQHLFKGNGTQVENNHTLSIGLSSSVDFMRKPKQ